MSQLNFEQARYFMIEQQIRTWDVLDQRILDLLNQVPREDFVPQAHKNLAFVDMNIPLGHEQVMMTPKLEARIVQELEINPDDRILEVGTGSGYLTALLAKLGKEVVSVEIFEDFTTAARRKLASHQIRNVTLETGDGARGWKQGSYFDVIVLTGSVPLVPDSLREQLGEGGRLFAIVGQSPAMEGKVIRRVGENSWASDGLFETDLPPLLNAEEHSRFVF
jgi:protein-L-isoaspartate(D-aspartate) O-methyltransferase